MTFFKPMKESELLAALAGHDDCLSGEFTKLEAVYRQCSCPQCGGSCQKVYDSRHAFSDPDTMVPRALLRCTQCKALFDPFTGIRVEMGNKGLVRPSLPLISVKD